MTKLNSKNDSNSNMNKCKDNMIKRRMLFQREQAEKKQLADTSVNNTIINEESGMQSLNMS